ncbi:MAG: fibronectin type III domain-containing protein [Paludibacter sp.]
MKNNIQLYSLSLLLLLSVFAFQSCTQKEEVKLDSPQLIMYTPTADMEGFSMKFVWTTLPNANYIVQISSDNFVSNIDTLLMNKDTTSVSVTGLNSNTTLYARIKAVSKDGRVKYADFKTSTIFLFENVFSNQTANIVNTGDITATSIKLSWLASRHVTSIIKTSGSVSDTTMLKAGDLTAQNKTFTGLLANTNYTFKIMKNKILRGTVTATTKAN